MHPVIFAFLLTTFAGLSTGVGSALAFFAKRTNYRFLSVATGFSAGVMLYVSFLEIMPKALDALSETYGEGLGAWLAAAAFFGGILLIMGIDRLVPEAENPHETHSASELQAVREEAAEEAAESDAPGASAHPHPHHKLHRMGLLTAAAIAIHNFPEGLVTFIAALKDPRLGTAIAIAIALHNIPEGISVSVPIFYATGSRKRAFLYSFATGLAEPLGALIGFLVLMPFMNGGVMGALFGGIAGIMVFISLDELLPTSRAFGKGHDSLYGLLGGMAVMALSLLLMQ